ncbi:unnamed protein product [Heligmosomoides polygyrus]|uniref:HEPN domain-containing protein n=1 Tax=Heligmosomoides polygyrus TaxID=6339 RepID=A0A183FTC9_HELPZ|nr:unnamed protein product [Heligmosomoides polygyrus]
MDLNKLLRNWVPNSRIAKDNHYVLCLDFLRFYLSQACTPCETVKKFACRLSGKGGKGALLDFPEPMASLVIDFLLDGFGLGVQELDSSVEQLIRNPTWYWTHLGRTDEERAGAHEERVTAKAVWAVEIRKALQKALNEVRCYHHHPDADVLVPSSKRGRADAHQGTNQQQGDEP